MTSVTGLSDEAALDDAEAAVASSLLIEDPASGGFLLSHDLVRQTLEETLSAARLARMHARIAEVMQAEEKQSPTMLPEVVVEIARHLILAESVVGANAAIPYLIAVADDARSRAAFHLAERALRTALELSARVADPARRTVLQFELRTRLVLQSNVISGPPGSRIFGQDDEPIDQGVSLAETDPLAWWGAQVLRFVEADPFRPWNWPTRRWPGSCPTASRQWCCTWPRSVTSRPEGSNRPTRSSAAPRSWRSRYDSEPSAPLIPGSSRYASLPRRCGP